MGPSTIVELDISQTVIAVATLVTAVGSAIAAWRRAARAEHAAQQVGEQVTPRNGGPTPPGYESTLAAQIEGQGRLLEVVDGRLHDLSRRVDGQDREMRDVKRHVTQVEAQVLSVADKQVEMLELLEDRLPTTQEGADR
jgi:hypothetical protein